MFPYRVGKNSVTSANMLFSVRYELFALYTRFTLGTITFHFYLLDHYKSLIKLAQNGTHLVELDPSESVRAMYIGMQYQNTLFISTVLRRLGPMSIPKQILH
jgi:hypothetical protein